MPYLAGHRRFKTESAKDAAVVLKSFQVRRTCVTMGLEGETPTLIDFSGQFPQLLPSERFRALNAKLRRRVIERIDSCKPTSEQPVEPSRPAKIWDECDVALRTRQLLAISCRVGWSGYPFGMHPDAQVEESVYRIKDGSQLRTEEILRADSIADLRDVLKARVTAQMPDDSTAQEADDWMAEVLSSMLHSPLLTPEGLVFRYLRSRNYIRVVLPWLDAKRFLQPAVIRAIEQPPN